MINLKSLHFRVFPSFVSKWPSTAGGLGTQRQPNSIEEISVKPRRVNDDYPVEFKETKTPPDIHFRGEDYTTIRILNVLRWESEYQGILKDSIDGVAEPTPEGIVAFSLVYPGSPTIFEVDVKVKMSARTFSRTKMLSFATWAIVESYKMIQEMNATRMTTKLPAYPTPTPDNLEIVKLQYINGRWRIVVET